MAEQKLRGIDILLYAGEEEDRKVVGGQRGATLNRSSEPLDTTAKDNEGGWKTSITGFKEWSIEAEGILMTGNEGFNAVEDAFLSSKPIMVELSTPGGRKYKGLGIITELPIEAPYDDMATYSLTIQGAGALEQEDN